MPQVKTWLKTDLSKPIQVRSLSGELFTFDNHGNVIGVEVYENGEPVTLTGTIAGYVIRPDGETVYIEGEKSGNRAKIVLPSTAYAYVGEITIIIRCVNGDEKTVIAACKAHVTRSETDDISGAPKSVHASRCACRTAAAACASVRRKLLDARCASLDGFQSGCTPSIRTT